MTELQTKLTAELETLTQQAFNAFCEDIGGMFDCTMQVADQKVLQGPLSLLKKELNKTVSVCTIRAEGTLQGECAIWFDLPSLFILSGVVVMLPEKRIQEQIKAANVKDAQVLTDAIKELGNMMVGSWDRIFRADLNGHKHFKLNAVFIGQPWTNPAESLTMDTEQECMIILTTIKVGNFEPAACAVVFPNTLFEPKPAQPAPPAPEPAAVENTPVPETLATETETAAAPEAAATETQAACTATGAVALETIELPAQPNPVSQAIEQLVQSETPAAPLPSAAAFHMAGSFDLNQPVQAVADAQPAWISPEDSIQKAILTMQQHNTGYLLVGKDGQLDGLLSRSDVASAVSPFTKAVMANYRRPLDDATFQIRIKWFMSRPVRAIPPQTPIWAAIDIMCRYAIRCLVVMDQNQKVTGLITVFDIFKKLISTDGSTVNGRISQTPPFLSDIKQP